MPCLCVSPPSGFSIPLCVGRISHHLQRTESVGYSRSSIPKQCINSVCVLRLKNSFPVSCTPCSRVHCRATRPQHTCTFLIAAYAPLPYSLLVAVGSCFMFHFRQSFPNFPSLNSLQSYDPTIKTLRGMSSTLGPTKIVSKASSEPNLWETKYTQA